MDSLESLPIAIKQLIVALFPAEQQALVSILVSITAILAVFPLLFGLTTVIERKGLGRIQNRYGPNRVGIPFTDIRLFGFGQFIADGMKMIAKEDIVPRAADRVVHFLAPVVIMIPALLAFAVIPYGRNMAPLDLECGLLFFFAVGASTELCVFMAGWSSRNKYSLLGAIRAIAQMVSYEVPLLLSTLTAVMIAGSLTPTRIVEAQAGFTSWGLANWFLFTPWGFAGFLLFLTAATAEANRSPFDMPEAESELIAGYFTEYSGFKFALFFLGEYLGLFAMSGLGITLFLGGWHAPCAGLEFVPSWAWFFAKLGALIVLFIWIRGTVPRLRADQLMGLAWKFMLPLALLNILVAGAWRFMTPGPARWLLCAAMLAIPYVMLGRALTESGHLIRRKYTFAE
ncbi:MAG: NADH-quinone oxidoreductase subunit NuoH [Verrucomicrobia bacterium]|nr:NADH-quinone oxidoreductase subunit NuoH [Verrucomicrobiota bacterium]